MGSFTDVVSGASTLASDINQYADRFNGTTGATIKVVAPANNQPAAAFVLPSAPATDQIVDQTYVNGDTVPRLTTYIRSADGFGGIRAGAGASITAHLYAQSSGWKIDEQLTITGQLNANGGISATTLTATGAIHGGSVFDNGSRVPIQGAHSSGQPILSYGTGTPAALATNEIFFQLA